MGKEGKYDLKLAPGLDAGDDEESDCNVSCTNNGGKYLLKLLLFKNNVNELIYRNTRKLDRKSIWYTQVYHDKIS